MRGARGGRGARGEVGGMVAGVRVTWGPARADCWLSEVRGSSPFEAEALAVLQDDVTKVLTYDEVEDLPDGEDVRQDGEETLPKDAVPWDAELPLLGDAEVP